MIEREGFSVTKKRENINKLADEEYISFVSFFKIFHRDHILKTTLITLFFLVLGVVYLFLATPKYLSHLNVEVETQRVSQNVPRGGNDLLTNINTPSSVDIETEMDVLKSDLLISKVLSQISDGVKYYDLNGFKKYEMYRKKPFVVKDIFVSKRSIFNRLFTIKVIDRDRYLISENIGLIEKIKSLFKKSKREKLKDRIGYFGKRLSGDGVAFVIEKRALNIGDKYGFMITYQPAQIKEIRRNLNIKPASARSSVIKISYEDTNPYRVKDFLDLYAKAYIEQNIEKKSKNASLTLKFLKKQLKEVKDKLKISSDRLRAYKEKNALIDVDTKNQELIDKITQYDREYSTAKLQYDSFELLKQDLAKGNYSAIGGFSDEYPILQELVAQLQDASTQKATLLTTLTKHHPDVITQQQRIENIKRHIRSVVNGIESSLKSRYREYKRLLAKANIALSKLPKKEQDLVILQRVFSVNENLYSYLLQRESELSLIKDSKVSDIRVLDRPAIELRPAKPNKFIVLVTSLFLGLLFSVIAAFIKFKKVIKDEEDISSIVSIPVIGKIPYIKDRYLYNKTYVLEYPNSGASDALREIRTNLEHIETEGKSKVILVTSSVPNEGKTVVAANLATILGMGDKKVIVLALDLRKPELHTKFKLPNQMGMSELLSGKVKLNDVIWEHSKYPNLNLITSGQVPKNPAELIDSQRMRELIEVLRESYDYIVIDSAPINYVPDTLSLFKVADITLFVVKSEVTKQSDLIEFEKLVEKLSIKRANIVINALKSRKSVKKYIDPKYAQSQAYA